MQLVCCLRFHLLPEVPQDQFFLPTLYNVHQHDGNFFPIGWLSWIFSGKALINMFLVFYSIFAIKG